MKKKAILIIGILLVISCCFVYADEPKILNEKVELTILTSTSESNIEDAAINDCKDTAQTITEQRKADSFRNVNVDVITVYENDNLAKINCSFELVGATTCSCPAKVCATGSDVNSCSASCDGDYGERAYCDCGSCEGISTSTCACY